MTFNELLELDKKAETTQRPRAAEEPKASSKPLPSPAPRPKPRPHDAKRDTTTPRYRDTTTPTMIKGIRKAVKQLGKEAATHRFTREEKDAIARIVFTYGQQGVKTCENEIARIGINWLLQDHQANSRSSILHKVLAALRA
ncbi:MAG: hypothetical protein GXY76_05240 [Chloroflexi bacterium]|nr:hypothetical protein [Chloroflexota bacterium]